MRVLLDTNIIIHREANTVVHDDIGMLFNWLDRLNCTKCVHPITMGEIKKHENKKFVHSMEIKLQSYHLIKTEAPIDQRIFQIITTMDRNDNDKNDSMLLNELMCNRVDLFITEDRRIHSKSEILEIPDRVFTINSYLEKVAVENPKLVDYKILSVKKEYFGNINLNDSFFDSFKNDYAGFVQWFNKKSDEQAYICKSGNHIIAFLYLKQECRGENYSDICPPFIDGNRLKIGTFKVTLNPFRLGERFLKIIFDNALNLRVEEIYVTIFPKSVGQHQLIELLKDWGFVRHGSKTSPSGEEEVYVRKFLPYFNVKDPKMTFPYMSFKNRIFLVPIYPQYHTELFPDSILRTESPLDFVENEPHRNAIKKAYICRSIERNIKSGDIILFYRTGGYYKGVVSTLGIVENIITNIMNQFDFIKLCRKRSIFSDEQLIEHWNYKPNNRPFIVNFLYAYSFKKRPNLKRLIELGVIPDLENVPRGFTPISRKQFELILKEAQVHESLIVD